MGNHLEAPNEGDWGRRIELSDFDKIADAGFNSIRLPVRWSNHASETAPYAIDETFMARVEILVDAALATGLNVVLDDHHYEDLHKNPAAHSDRLGELWRQIAARFADRPTDSLWFEIANEPNDQLTNENLLETLAPALAAIRETNPTRAVIYGGQNWSGINSLETLRLPDDPHVIPTFHYYDPFAFTHQGATWVDSPPPLGRTYGSEEDQAALTADVEKLRAYIARTGKTPFIGEFGAHTTVPLEGRVPYYRAVREAFEGEVSGYCAWGYAATFPLYDDASGAWNPGMLAAMGLAGG
ncbi:MAG: glycoside hydrolase family 5 protein [Pacificimonas sp.]